MKGKKVEIMYFYSDLYENKKKLSKVSKRLLQERRDIRIRLVNVENPRNEELTELYRVNMIPVVIFLTPGGEIAARRSVPLSEEDVIHEVADRISHGELPNPVIEETRTKILDAFHTVTKRNDLTQLIAEQVENDLMDAGPESEIYELINYHISVIDHTINDLEGFRRTLQRFLKNQNDFIV